MNKRLLILSTLAMACLGFMPTDVCAQAKNSRATKVLEYSPAPGQFVNVMPLCEEGDTPESMRLKAQQRLADGGIISLGTFGGYVVLGFEHMVQNRPGMYDLQILGNSYYAGSANSSQGGSSEPGIVYVSHDTNANGLADDQWYELRGSEHGRPTTYTNYSVTYHRTAADHKPTPIPNTPIIDSTYIRWTDSYGAQGYVTMNSYHRQNYWPQWQSGQDSLTFTGVRLAPNSEDKYGNGTYFLQKPYAWGYADNQPNNNHASMLDLQWAIDADGKPANLPGIHFVKVQTATLQCNGWIGESSTEVAGVIDLQAEGIDEASVDAEHLVLTFEDEDYANHYSYWSNLIDTIQYGGTLLYGTTGTGAYTYAEAYKWYDAGRTNLASTVNYNWGSWAYWNGGIAVSNYVGTNLKDVDFEQQLAVYHPSAGEGHQGGGFLASNNFAVISGVDNTPYEGSDNRAELRFANGADGIIQYAYFAPTTLFLSNMLYGSSFCTAATEDTYVDLVVQGYDLQGNLTATAALRLQEGLHHANGWMWMDLSVLGRVNKVKFDFHVSPDQASVYGVNTPTYVAIDNIAVSDVSEGDTAIDTILPSNTAQPRMYDLMGRQLRTATKGQIVIVNGKKVIF